MPFVITFPQAPNDLYLHKDGSKTPDFRRARVYRDLGAVKNSLMGDRRYEDCVIQEVELRLTGRNLTWDDVIGKHVRAKEEKARLERERRTSTERLAERKRELAELARLKEKYES